MDSRLSCRRFLLFVRERSELRDRMNSKRNEASGVKTTRQNKENLSSIQTNLKNLPKAPSFQHASVVYSNPSSILRGKVKKSAKHLAVSNIFPTFALANEGETYSANGEIAQLVRASDS